MWVSKIRKEELTNDVVDRLLFEGLYDNGASVDCIIVLGSIKAAKYRVPVAAEVFFSGRSEKIMLCGGKIRNFSSECMAEADNMYKKALELGIPETSIIIEKSSQNTYLFPSHINVYPCPADDITTKRDNWMNTPEGIHRAKEEALNIIRCVNNKLKLPTPIGVLNLEKSIL